MINLSKPPTEERNGYKDPDRLRRIHEIPCSLCLFLNQRQATRTTAHHKVGMGIGKKASDILTMSLCEEHHQKGQDAIQHIGRKAFEEKFIDQDSLIKLTDKMLSKL